MRYPGAYFREAVDYIESLCDRVYYVLVENDVIDFCLLDSCKINE